MNRFAIPALILSAATLYSGAVQAMEVQQFDKMADDDQGEYIADLILGAEHVLRDAGQPDQVSKVQQLFSYIAPGDDVSLGMAELNVNLAGARAAETSRQARNPALRHLTVEDAFKATVQDHGIQTPDAFLTVNSGFKPKQPPKK